MLGKQSIQLPEPASNQKITRVKSYCNLSSKTKSQNKTTENVNNLKRGEHSQSQYIAQEKQNENSPKFLQINLKMFNNYLESNNPQYIYDSVQNASPGTKFKQDNFNYQSSKERI